MSDINLNSLSIVSVRNVQYETNETKIFAQKIS